MKIVRLRLVSDGRIKVELAARAKLTVVVAPNVWSLGHGDAVSIVKVVLRIVAQMTLLAISELLVSLIVKTDVVANLLASISLISRYGDGIN